MSTEILPGLASARTQASPVVVFVAGQPGSGKSTAAQVVKAALDRRGGAVLIGSDLYKALHPCYATLLVLDEQQAGARVRATVRQWQDQVEWHAREVRCDTVIETALADTDHARSALSAFRRAGYRVELIVLAVAEPVSQLALLGRYLHQADATGQGRFVGWDNHDACASGLLDVLRVVEDEGLVDRVTVLDREHRVLHVDTLTDGARQRGACAAVAAERQRPWTAAETARFRHDQAHVERLAGRARADRALPVGTAVDRAVALAEPVRRTAQVTPRKPGVDFHRLSRTEHDWTFEELIWSSYEPLVRRQDNPVVVYVMAQPGAGKTGVATMIKRGMEGRGALRIEADMLKVFHPDFADLQRADPRTAGAKVRADVKGWQRSFEARLRAARSDLVIEVAPGSTRQLLDSARPFAQAGYRVELVTLAVRASDSLLGTAQRYASLQKAGLPSRFTTRIGHDVCHAAVADALAAAEREDTFAQVMVVDRDGHPLYRSRRDAAGCLDRAPAAAQVLAAARARPYAQPEAHRFLREVSRLWALLPQYRAELVATAALAGPLLPPVARPALASVADIGFAKSGVVATCSAGRLRLREAPLEVLVPSGQSAELGAGQLLQS